MALPGTTDLAGLGEPNTLEPGITSPQINRLTRRHSFLGAAFYDRSFEVPQAMAGKPLKLKLERVIWQSSVWIDGKPLAGAEESLTTPHYYLIPAGLSAGKHEIRIRIDNRKRYDLSANGLAHAYTNDTQVIWNGVLGDIELTAIEPVELAQTDIYADPKTHTAKVVSKVVRHDDTNEVIITYQVDREKRYHHAAYLTADTTLVEYKLQLEPDAELWDEFNPALHTLKISTGADTREISFGIRSFESVGKDLKINGRKIFLRGTLDCCIFPLTGNPPTDDAGWEKVFKTCQEWGVNHVRFHSWCPPDAAFRVADRLGIYLQPELPDWARNIGEGKIDAFLLDEYERIISNYGNHPSFVMFSCGNELDRGYDWLDATLRYMKKADPRHLYTNSTYSMGAGHKGFAEPQDEFMIASRTSLGQIRGQDYIDSRSPNFYSDFSSTANVIDIPLISHEIGQYSVYPRMAEIEKYTGTLDPLNFKGVRNILESKGRLDRAEDYTQASGRLAAILYKEEVERALKTPALSGFQMLGLQDFSGQSTALVGLLDAFWESKGLVDAAWFRQACAPVVPLARYVKPCWTSAEEFAAELEVANYWSDDIKSNVVWSLKDGKKTIGSGKIAATIPTGGNTKLSEAVKVSLGGIQKPVQLKFEATVEGTKWHNSWDIWVYPAEQTVDLGDVVLARTAEEALEELSKGGTVLLSPDMRRIKGEKGKFVPVFWSPVFFPFEAGTMGVLCDPNEPALAGFPTEMHSNWQWWNLTKNSKAMDIDALPSSLKTIVEAVDNFTQNRRLAYVFEAECEGGRLIFSAFDLLGETLKDKPEAQCMLGSLVDYMNSDKFKPSTRISKEELESYIYPEGYRPRLPYFFFPGGVKPE